MKKTFLYFIIFSFVALICCDTPQVKDQIDEKAILDSMQILFASLDSLPQQDSKRIAILDTYKQSLLDDHPPQYRQKKLGSLALYLFKKGSSKEYIGIEHEMQEISRAIGDSVALAKSLSYMAEHYRSNNLLDSAFTKFYDAAKVYESIEKHLDAGLKWLSMAIIQKGVKDYAGSEASSIRALEMLNIANNTNEDKEMISRYLASTYNNLGLIAKERGQYEMAIEYNNRAIENRKHIDKDGTLAAGSYNNIGLVYANSGNYEKAIEFYKKGLNTKPLLDTRPKTYARLVDNMAYAMHKSNSRDNLDSLFFMALDMRTKLSDISGIGTSNYHIASYKADQGLLDEAEKYALNALRNSKEAGDNKGVLETLDLLTTILPPEMALDYAKEYIDLSSKLEKADRVYQDQFARVRYETETLLTANKRVTRNFKQLTIVFLLTIVVFLLGYIWRQRISVKREEDYQRAQQKSTEEIYSLMLAQSAKIEEGKQLEKKRISEELHDNVLSKLFGIRISLDSVHKKEGEEVVRARAAYLKELQEITQEIRQISHDLNRDPFMGDQLFPEVLDGLITDYGEQARLEATLSFDKKIQWDDIEDATKAHLYRIIQESLTNAHKHGKAKNVEVSFQQDETHLTATILDDGIGLDLKRLKRGIGLKNIASRTEQIEGDFYILNREPKGTAIEIRFPRKIM